VEKRNLVQTTWPNLGSFEDIPFYFVHFQCTPSGIHVEESYISDLRSRLFT